MHEVPRYFKDNVIAINRPFVIQKYFSKNFEIKRSQILCEKLIHFFVHPTMHLFSKVATRTSHLDSDEEITI